MTTPIASEPELPALVKKALRRAFSLGEVHWQQADSESYSQNKKADATQAKFAALIEETIAALSSRSGSAAETAGDRIMRLEKALKWYRDEAAALSKHMPSGANTQAVLASLTVLSLDGGRRADAAMCSDGNTEGEKG